MAQNFFGKTDSRGSTPVTYNFTPLSSAEPFSTSKPYAVGDYVFYEGVLYRCKTDKAAGAWAPTKFEEANLGDDLDALDKDVSALKEDIKDNYAKNDGYYDGMTVGNAEQIVGTVFEEDDTAYNYRTTGGSAEVGDRAYVDAIIGGSLPWNQMVQNGNFESTSGWSSYKNTLVASGNIATATIANEETLTSANINHSFAVQSGHKYVLAFSINSSESGNTGYYVNDGGIKVQKPISAGVWTQISTVRSATSISSTLYLYLPEVANAVVQIKNVMAVDLTAMFGSTIADYIYSLETAHAGDGVAWFKRYFPKPYYAYHAVGMEHVNAVAAKTVGFNQWDEEWETGIINNDTGQNAMSGEQIRSKNYIRVFPNTQYYFKSPAWAAFYYYDADKNYLSRDVSFSNSRLFTTPTNCGYMRFVVNTNYGTTYNHDINISIRWDNSRDGDYEPYNLHTYPLADLTLRGIPKKDESGNLYFDGDRYLPDGTVERRYGVIVFDGTEEFHNVGSASNYYYIGTKATYDVTSWQMQGVFSNIAGTVFTNDGLATKLFAQFDGQKQLRFTSGEFDTKEKFTNFLASQYAAGNPVTIVYELATPTTEEADPYQYPMVVDNWGTEELIDGKVESGDRDVAIPVGHETKYPPNLKDKLESAANNPDADGVYVLTHDGGSNTYTPLASNATIQNIIARLEALEGGGENE